MSTRRAALRADLLRLLPVPQAIVWEIGSGHGHFLTQYAATFPQKTCFGVDLSSERIGRSLRKSDRARLPNCHFIRADAQEFYAALPTGITFAEIWVLFPDPWPKKRHHKNRVMQPGFLETIANRAGEGAKLYFRTDHEEYYRFVTDYLPSLATWELGPASPWPLEPDTVFQARAARYHSLVAIRKSHSAKPAETIAPTQPLPANPKSIA